MPSHSFLVMQIPQVVAAASWCVHEFVGRQKRAAQALPGELVHLDAPLPARTRGASISIEKRLPQLEFPSGGRSPKNALARSLQALPIRIPGVNKQRRCEARARSFDDWAVHHEQGLRRDGRDHAIAA
jgi:hypothetical protein